LRHTAIMFRLTESKGLDLLSLARAARTSVEMLDRFYAKHLTAEMNVELIQSNRNQTLEDVNTEITKRVNLTKTSNSNSADPAPDKRAKVKTPPITKAPPKRTRTSSKVVQKRQP
jgi:ribosomal protein L31E